jgi:hypothetical protein
MSVACCPEPCPRPPLWLLVPLAVLLAPALLLLVAVAPLLGLLSEEQP